MSAPFATTLLERFQQHGLMRLQPDQFLLAVRRMGANFSAKECRSVVKHVGTDAQGFVNIHGFCAWFENIENEARRSRSAESSSTSDASDAGVENNTALSEFQNVAQHEPLGADGGPSQSAVGAEVEHDSNAEGRGEVEEVEAHARVGGLLQRPRLNLDLAVQFDPEVKSDDGAVLHLEDIGEDKCTLPSHRKLSEHEKLMASFRSDLAEVKGRLASGPVEHRTDLR